MEDYHQHVFTIPLPYITPENTLHTILLKSKTEKLLVTIYTLVSSAKQFQDLEIQSTHMRIFVEP